MSIGISNNKSVNLLIYIAHKLVLNTVLSTSDFKMQYSTIQRKNYILLQFHGCLTSVHNFLMLINFHINNPC
jgi:hypothetical protein